MISLPCTYMYMPEMIYLIDLFYWVLTIYDRTRGHQCERACALEHMWVFCVWLISKNHKRIWIFQTHFVITCCGLNGRGKPATMCRCCFFFETFAIFLIRCQLSTALNKIHFMEKKMRNVSVELFSSQRWLSSATAIEWKKKFRLFLFSVDSAAWYEERNNGM